MPGDDNEKKLWSAANLVIIAMAGIIGTLLSIGFIQISAKIENGDNMIYQRLAKIEESQKNFTDNLMAIQRDITRIDTLQKIRLDHDKEVREDKRKNGKN
jgi:hypothetical protein